MRLARSALALAALLACNGTAPVPPATRPARPGAGGEAPAPVLVCEDPGSQAGEPELRRRLVELQECAPLRLALARVLETEGRCGDAQRELERLLDGSQSDASAARLALVRLASGPCGDPARRRVAGVVCQELLAGAGSEARAWIACGALEEARGETARAMAHYQRARELDPNAVEAVAAPAALALRFRDFASAASLYDAYARARPQAFDAWRGLAFARRGLGDLAGAIGAMERAVALNGHDAELRYHLAHWLRENGATEPALAQLRAFLAAAADEPRLARARAEARVALERWGAEPDAPH